MQSDVSFLLEVVVVILILISFAVQMRKSSKEGLFTVSLHPGSLRSKYD